MIRILVLGGSGMLGGRVFRILSRQFETYATFRNNHNIPEPSFWVDVTDFDRVAEVINFINPDVIINCVGILKQNTDPITSIEVNALFPHRLAELGIRTIHVSTDCVFEGTQGNYNEEGVPDAGDLYGRTKLLGELPECLTIRTSFIGRNGGLLKWFLDNDGGKVQGYTNAIFSGLTVQALARILADLIADYPDMRGIYHVSSEPISKYNLLVKIRDAMDLDIEIEPHGDFHCDRSLDSTLFRAKTGYCIPGWDKMIAEL